MTGYQSKRAAAQDKLAQPAQEFNRTWVCNECGSQQFTSAICEADLDYLACSNCGGNEFHKEALVQPAQERQWIWLSDADIAEVVDTTCQYTGGYEEYLIKKAERKIRSMNNGA